MNDRTNVLLLKKLKLYNETEVTLSDPGNKLIVGFMKVAVENRILITLIKRNMNEQVAQLTKQVDQLERSQETRSDEPV
jgi:hypothetical protein